MTGLLPHLSSSPVLACFGLSDTPKLHSAIRSVVKKYPDITLACFDMECYQALDGVSSVNVLFSPGMQESIIKKYNVIGALVGSGYDANTYSLKEMRV